MAGHSPALALRRGVLLACLLPAVAIVSGAFVLYAGPGSMLFALPLCAVLVGAAGWMAGGVWERRSLPFGVQAAQALSGGRSTQYVAELEWLRAISQRLTETRTL